jgi:hypothetical protein
VKTDVRIKEGVASMNDLTSSVRLATVTFVVGSTMEDGLRVPQLTQRVLLHAQNQDHAKMGTKESFYVHNCYALHTHHQHVEGGFIYWTEIIRQIMKGWI